jgi:uncharacterized RDD family membrane protein YckC
VTTPTEPGQPGDQTPGGYGGTPPPGYGMPPAPEAYGAATPGMPELASWGLRAQSALVDWFGPSLVAALITVTISNQLGRLLQLVALAWALYQAYQGGKTGQSMGKKWAGTRLLREQDGQVFGGGMGVARYFVHILDAIPCYVGFLWPLWDSKKQTFADKILKTVVVKA